LEGPSPARQTPEAQSTPSAERLSRWCAIAGLLLALLVLAQAAFGWALQRSDVTARAREAAAGTLAGVLPAGLSQRRVVEHFALLEPGKPGSVRALARLTRLETSPGRWLLHRELDYPLLGWRLHTVEEFGPGQRRLVHREVSPRRGYSWVAEWSPLDLQAKQGGAPWMPLAAAPQALEEALTTGPIEAREAYLPRARRIAVHGSYSGSGARQEQHFEAGAELCGPLLLLERTRWLGPGEQALECLLPERAGAASLTEVRRAFGPAQLAMRHVQWRRADGSLRQQAWLLGPHLIGFAAEESGASFARVSAECYGQLVTQPGPQGQSQR
jgi:hypothetical protein